MMKKAFILCPGQGAQYIGMGKDFIDNPICAQFYERASHITGWDVKKLCLEGPQEELDRTDRSQIAILVTSYAAYVALKEARKDVSIEAVAGLSLGEYSALLCAGALDFDSAVRLVDIRGKLMQAASEKTPGAMSAVLGADEKLVYDISAPLNVELANFNCPGQIVISGRVQDVEQAEKALKEVGVKKVIRLAVSGAFHCSLLAEAQSELNRYIDATEIVWPEVDVYSSITGEKFRSVEEIKDALKRQLVSPTLWQKAMENALQGNGGSVFVELPPAKVLKGIMKKISSTVQCITVGSINDFALI